MSSPKIIFEDSSLLVIDKPTGWVVNDADTTKHLQTIQSWIKANTDSPIKESKEYRAGIVHRLDKDTSGILLVAKSAEAFKELQSQFKKRTVNKQYTALVHGQVEPEEGVIKVPLGRLPWNRERFGVLPGGRPSETLYKAKKVYQSKNDTYTLVDLKPVTGRTHQIRIHMSYLGHALVADPFYAGRKRAKRDKAWCPRLFLHASQIEFTHPKTHKKVAFKSPLPKDLSSALYTLKALT